MKTSSHPQGIVYEPFAGSATAGVVCHKLARRWIGSEVSEDACRFALDRLKEAGCETKLCSRRHQFSRTVTDGMLADDQPSLELKTCP